LGKRAGCRGANQELYILQNGDELSTKEKGGYLQVRGRETLKLSANRSRGKSLKGGLSFYFDKARLTGKGNGHKRGQLEERAAEESGPICRRKPILFYREKSC